MRLPLVLPLTLLLSACDLLGGKPSDDEDDDGGDGGGGGWDLGTDTGVSGDGGGDGGTSGDGGTDGGAGDGGGGDGGADGGGGDGGGPDGGADGGGGDGGGPDGGADGGGGDGGGGDGGAASLDGEWRGAIDIAFEVEGTSVGSCFTPLDVELVDNRFEGEWELRCEGPVATFGLGLGLDGWITGSGLAGEAHLVSEAETLSTPLSGAVSTERIELTFELRDGSGSSAVVATGEGMLTR